MTAPNPFRSLLIPSCPALEASEVARKLKQAATKKAWAKANPERVRAAKKAWATANPDKQRLYWRTHVEKMQAAAVPAQPVPVEVTLSDLMQQVAELKALVMQLMPSR